ncbi:putative UPF0644 protein PB2B4.06 [Amylocarpus encephaloides]|uniref:UPF0644 protein PB2B4.06 n=1 Tax=Amylocarpus encephaloides TaxID=45428 RepID=A0A9P7YUK7_9HELO|nr:putative UPF0644 protein PB2B4.06 [Amylocarpus encephaloides]
MSLAGRLMTRQVAAGLFCPSKRLLPSVSGKTTIQQKFARLPRTFTTTAQLFSTQANLPPPKSLLSRTLGFFSIAILFTSIGVYMGVPSAEVVNGLLHHPTDQETLTMYVPDDETERKINDFIRDHPVSVDLRSRPEFSESRPHMKVPAFFKPHNLTAGTLMGPGKVAVPPFAWTEKGGKSFVAISYLGGDLCGHPGIIHGGMLATMLDEGLARCCFPALPNKIGVTANLNINYRAPAPAGVFVVLRAKTTKAEGRKAWVEGHIETLVGEGEKPVILAEATALFIEPKHAAVSPPAKRLNAQGLTKINRKWQEYIPFHQTRPRQKDPRRRQIWKQQLNGRAIPSGLIQSVKELS